MLVFCVTWGPGQNYDVGRVMTSILKVLMTAFLEI